MKRNLILTVVFLLTLGGAAKAQTEESVVGRFSVIPRVGVALANWSNNSIWYMAEGSNGKELKSRYQAGFMGGVDVEYRATQEVGISLGAYYAKQGFRYPSYEAEIDADKGKYQGVSDYHCNLNYLNVPLVVKAFVTRRLALLVGVQAGFLLGDAKWKNETIDIDRDQYGNSTYKESYTNSSPWPTKKVDLSLPIGLSYEYMGVVLDARYNLGLTNVDNIPNVESTKSKNRVFTFSVGYRFCL